MKGKQIVIVNQAVNYLTIGIANELKKEYKDVSIITGSIHTQGEELDTEIKISRITKYSEGNIMLKIFNWILASVWIFSLLLLKYRKYEILYITNPPIAYFSSLFLSNKFSIIMWDVYPDILKVYNITNESVIYRVWAFLNKILFKKAFRIYSIGEKLSKIIANYVENDKVFQCNLWTVFDNKEIKFDKGNPFVKENNLDGKFVIQYSGNIGATHNIESLIYVAELLKTDSEILIQIIGRGTNKSFYEKLVNEKKLNNIEILPFQSDEMFPYSLAAADVGVVVLDNRVSSGSVPSKTYNLMRASKPILYIASQESELYIYSEKFNNGKCFDNSNIDAISEFLLSLKSNKKYYELLSQNSLTASKFFQRSNAKTFVTNHLNLHE
jgi:glycosyltransferase involved in cell wall biosynthesis